MNPLKLPMMRPLSDSRFAPTLYDTQLGIKLETLSQVLTKLIIVMNDSSITGVEAELLRTTAVSGQWPTKEVRAIAGKVHLDYLFSVVLGGKIGG